MPNKKNKQKIKHIFLFSQSLELGRAHKKASSIVNATIDPDKVIQLYFCSIAILWLSQDIYAIPSRGVANSNSNQRLIYFLSIVDVLTHYGVKKAAAKVNILHMCISVFLFLHILILFFSQAAKTVKYGSSVDGISTAEPEQYAKR